MTLSETQCRHTLNIARVILLVDSLGYAVKVSYWNRTPAEQAALVAAGKSKTMNSLHLELRATDLILFKNGKPILDNGEAYRPLGEFWESLGAQCRWGGRFHDPEEFRRKHGRDFDKTKDVGWDAYHFESQMEF